MNKDSLKQMQKAVLKVTKDRHWGKFHTPKNMAMDLVREASEVLEHFIWDTNTQIKKDKKRIKEIGAEIGDVLHSLLLLADTLKIDVTKAFWKKLEQVKKKYPVKDYQGISGYDCKKKLNRS